MNLNNLILATDSYKLCHHQQYPEGTEGVYSYFESRPGATYPYTVFFGLQAILKKRLVGSVISWDDISEALALSTAHFGSSAYFNYEGWAHIMETHGGRLPLKIRAVPEGTVVPTGNVLMTVENTDPAAFWLTNAVESLLTHVWYPSTVATLSRHTKGMLAGFLDSQGAPADGLPFMLHDFGYRGASSDESARMGGMGHLLNFMGTDTLPAMPAAYEYYNAPLEDLAFSVAATEHSVMTALGEDGEKDQITRMLDLYPTGILSIVGDSYDIYRFVRWLGSDFKDRILARDGKIVVRPDSVTRMHQYPEQLVAWIAGQLWNDFGGTTNAKGFKVLDSHIGIIWGDGIDPHGMELILTALAQNGFSAENIVFGMGGGLLQKVNRDTQRFAFKASAIKRHGEWHGVHKTTPGKTSKAGRLALVEHDGKLVTISEAELDRRVSAAGVDGDPCWNVLRPVFENGNLITEYTFAEARANADQRVTSTA